MLETANPMESEELSRDLPWYHIYHLSSLSPMNLFTTGDPISALSQDVLEPKSNTRPLDNVGESA